MSKVVISEETRKVLSRASISDTGFVLAGQLTPKEYQLVKKAANAIGAKWDRKSGEHVFKNSDSKELFKKLVIGEEVIDKKKAFQQFDTPQSVAHLVVTMANIQKDDTVLEPSAGTGNIVKELLKEVFSKVVCVEIDKSRCEGFPADDRIELHNKDFLKIQFTRFFKKIIMNPPWFNNQDIKHVTKALSMLSPGGTLVAIMSPHWTFANDKLSKEFRERIEEYDYETVSLPEGTFKESGTNVRSIIVRINKCSI